VGEGSLVGVWVGGLGVADFSGLGVDVGGGEVAGGGVADGGTVGSTGRMSGGLFW